MESTQQDKSDPASQTSSALGVPGHHRSQRSKSSEDSASARPPLERGTQLVNFDSQNPMLAEKKKQDESEIPQDLSKHGSNLSRETSSETTETVDMQFVLVDDDDDDIEDDEFMQTESLDSPGEASLNAAGSENRSPGFFLKCSMCDRVFSSQQRLMLHINKHMGAKPYACPQCPANFNSRASFQRHRRSHKNSMADIQTHTCTLCHAQFSDIQHLTEHLKIHTEKRRSCPHCGIFIGGSRSMQKHISIEHPSMVKTYKKHRPPNIPVRIDLPSASPNQLPSTSNEGEKPVSCRRCGRQFQTNRALQGHMKGHSRLYQWNPRRCKCGILLADEAEYQRHLKNSCCSASSSLDMLSPPVDSPGSLSPVSPNSAAHLMALSAQRQANIRSRSLDSFLRNPPAPFAFVNRYPASAEGSLVDFPQSLAAQSAESTHSMGNLHFENSPTSKETPSSQSTSEQRSQSPVNRITIKTEAEDDEEWSEVVNIVQVHSNTTTSEEPSADGDCVQDQPPDFSLNREEQKAHKGRPEQPAANTITHTRQNERDDQLRKVQPLVQSGAEASSSSGTIQLERPVEPPTVPARFSVPLVDDPRRGQDCGPSLGRVSSESPNMQISSSQSSQPPPNPLVNTSLMGERDQEGLPWRCSFCGITFEDSLMYVIHKGCHEPGSRFRCSMCGEQCADKVTFMLHFVRGQHTKPTHV
nr:zinc finger and BTB domain-containing protein 24-like [Lytechinus pictus]